MKTSNSAKIPSSENPSGLAQKSHFKSCNNFHPSSTSKIGWIESEKKLITLHSFLYSYGLIDCKFDPFRKHFIGASNGISTFIKWYGDVTQLVYLFDLLISSKCIPDHRTKRHVILKDHFFNRFGENLNTQVMRTLLNQLKNDSDGNEMIEEILDKSKISNL